MNTLQVIHALVSCTGTGVQHTFYQNSRYIYKLQENFTELKCICQQIWILLRKKIPKHYRI